MTNTTTLINQFAAGDFLKDSEWYVMQSSGLIEEVLVDDELVGYRLTKVARRVLKSNIAAELEVRRQPSKLR